jgi:hypothetical protein
MRRCLMLIRLVGWGFWRLCSDGGNEGRVRGRMRGFVYMGS